MQDVIDQLPADALHRGVGPAPSLGGVLDSPVLAAAAKPWATGPVNAAQLFAPPRVLTREGYEQRMDDFQGRLAAAMQPGNLRLDLLPLGPFGGTLADLGYTKLPTMSGGNPGRPLLGHDIGMRLLDAGVRAAGKPAVVGKAGEGGSEGDKKEAPPFPGFDAPVGQIIGWAQFYNQVKAKFPDELSFDAIKEQAKNFLIQQGLGYVKGELEKLAVDAVAAALGPAMDDAIKTAWEKAGGLLDKVGAILDDPLGKAEELLVSQLPNLANKGIDALLGGVFGDDAELSGGGLVAKLAAKELLSGMSAAMLDGVKNLDGLMSNFENMQTKLFGQLKKFFTGGEFTPGQAFLPLVRQADTDDKVDFVLTGLGTVVAEGLPAARVLDTLLPSGQPIAIGSGNVLIGGLPAARQTSLTSVPSVMKTGAGQVLVEGVTVASVTPAGVPYCPADPKAAAAALAKPAAGAAAGGGGGKGGPKGDGKAADGGAKAPAKPAEKPAAKPADKPPAKTDPAKPAEGQVEPKPTETPAAKPNGQPEGASSELPAAAEGAVDRNDPPPAGEEAVVQDQPVASKAGEERLLCINSNRAEGDTPPVTKEQAAGTTTGGAGAGATGTSASGPVAGTTSGAVGGSSGGGLGTTFGGNGHANLSVHHPDGSTTTYGKWPDGDYAEDNGPGSDVRVDHKWDKPADYPYSHCVPISEAQHRQLQEIIANDTSQWGVTNNCSSFASDTFYEVTGKDIDADGLMGAEFPAEVGEHIMEANNGQRSNRPGTK